MKILQRRSTKRRGMGSKKQTCEPSSPPRVTRAHIDGCLSSIFAGVKLNNSRLHNDPLSFLRVTANGIDNLSAWCECPERNEVKGSSTLANSWISLFSRLENFHLLFFPSYCSWFSQPHLECVSYKFIHSKMTFLIVAAFLLLLEV